MTRRQQNLKSLRVLFRTWREAGILEPGQKEVASSLVKRLDHALTVKDLKSVEKIVSEICVLFLRSTSHTS